MNRSEVALKFLWLANYSVCTLIYFKERIEENDMKWLLQLYVQF